MDLSTVPFMSGLSELLLELFETLRKRCLEPHDLTCCGMSDLKRSAVKHQRLSGESREPVVVHDIPDNRMTDATAFAPAKIACSI